MNKKEKEALLLRLSGIEDQLIILKRETKKSAELREKINNWRNKK